jgi:type III secretion protein U
VSDKTEDPTPRRLRRAREEGDSGASGYAAQAVALVAAVALVPAAVRALASRTSDDLRAAIERAAHPARGLQVDPQQLATTVIALASPVLLAAAVAGAAAYVVQTGGTVATRRLAPRLDRLNPVAGLKGLLSGARLFAVVRSLVAGVAVGWLAYDGLARHLTDFARAAGRVHAIGVLVSHVAEALAWRAALLGLALGAVDVLVNKRARLQRLKMSKDEVKREYREVEGDPEIKRARERAYHELIAQATVAGVRRASVVVVNPTHVACALRYDEKGGDEAPVVVASGEGELAARILQAAREWGVPVVRDLPLARALVELSVGDAIPEALYEAVAEILRELQDEERGSEGSAP